MRLPITITSMWRGMHFRAQWGWPIYGSALAWELCRAHVDFWDYVHAFYLIRFPDMDTEWGNDFLLHFTLMCLVFLIDEWRSFRIGFCIRIAMVRNNFFLCPSTLSISIIWRSLYVLSISIIRRFLLWYSAKGHISFGAAHSQFFSAWFVMSLPIYFSIVVRFYTYLNSFD